MASTKDRVEHLGASVGLTDEELIEMYRLVALARAVDERMWILNRAGRIPFVISGQGHEGAQVAMAWPMRKQHDWVAPFYRSIATCLTFGMSARDILTAQYATASILVRRAPDARPLRLARAQPGVGVVAGGDAAAACRRHRAGRQDPPDGPGRHGDHGRGSSNQGDVHEGPNFAAIHKLPFVFVVENNGYAISVPMARQVAGSSVWERAAGYGIPGVVVDGADVLACYHAAKVAVDRARAGDGPTLIEAKVMRLTAHSSDDQQTKYRSEEELAAEKERDPLPRFRDQLREAGILTEEVEVRLSLEIQAAVDDATPTPRRSPTRTRRPRWTGSSPSAGRPRRSPWGFGTVGGHAAEHEAG